MKKSDLKKVLGEIGLSDNEATVYLGALSLGPSTILNIAKSSEIKRTTVYSVVESLKQKGLMHIEEKGFKQLYTAENPEKLEDILETRKKKLKKLLPEFSSLYNLKGGESIVKYYEGVEGVKTIYEELLRDIQPHQKYVAVSNSQKWLDTDEVFFEKYIERRAKLRINSRLIVQDSELARERQKNQKNYSIEIKIFPKETRLTSSFTVTPQRLIIHQLVPPVMAIVIENESVINLHYEMFEIMWQGLPSTKEEGLG